MADPVGFAASILTLTDAAVAVGKFINHVRHCPSELLAVSNEINDLRYVLTEVEKLHGEEELGRESTLEPILRRSRKIVEDVNQFVELLHGDEKWKLSVVDRVKWSIIQKEKAATLIQKLREIRSQLDTLIVTSTARDLRRMTRAVEELRLVTSINSRSSVTFPTTMSDGAEKSTTSSDIVGPETPTESDKTAVTITSNPIPTNTDVADPPSYVSLCVRRIRTCKPWCSCACHAQTYLSTPTMLNQVFGSLFVGYTGSPISRTPCNVAACVSYSSRPRARATYFFPSWFYSKAVDAAFFRGPFGDLSANITIRGVQLRTSQVFEAVSAGDIPLLQNLFSEGKARPTDIDHHGTTLLFAAVAYRRHDTVKFLLSAGADPHYPNKDRISAFDRAWDGIITCQALHDPSRNMMRDIFNDTCELDTWQLSRVHKIVLGLLPHDLRQELEISTSEINALDLHDRSPLWWAVATASPNFVQILLEFGADPNTADCEGAPPLRKATAADRLDIFLLLLKHGADPNWKTNLGMQITHTVMSYNLDIQYLESSLNPSLDLNARGGYSGNTPLLIAVRANNLKKVEWLLEHGVEVDKRDREGYAPLMLAVVRNFCDIIALLLKHGADPTLLDPWKRNIVTLAAGYGIRDTHNVLATFGVAKALDLDAEINGRTTRELVNLDGFDPGGKTAFLRLLNTQVCEKCIQDAQAGVSAGVSLGMITFDSPKPDDDEFYDAKDTKHIEHTHPDVPEGLLDDDLGREEVVVDELGRVFVRNVLWPEMWMLQRPGQDLVAQNRQAARMFEEAGMRSHEVTNGGAEEKKDGVEASRANTG